jgi:hypothetical protein
LIGNNNGKESEENGQESRQKSRSFEVSGTKAGGSKRIEG